jgi:dTDP-4-amino-4,6-dideoxygalactose transaminase
MFGAKLKQIDIESSTGGACYEDLIKKTTKKTKCIAISAINGRISESIFKIIKFAKSKNIPILIDGASALGSKKNGIPILSLADISITSFSSSKLISSGQGGAGGSGVIFVSVPTANYTGTTTGSPTVTTSGANTILKFTGSGSYTA